MNRKEQVEFNATLTELTGIKHYPSVGEMLESEFEKRGFVDDSGNKIKMEASDYECPHYQGVCGLDESIICFSKSNRNCDIRLEAST